MDGRKPRKPKTSRKRRLATVFLACLVLGVAAVAALPWLLSTAPAREAVTKAVNRALAPSTVGIGGLSAGWAGPIRVRGLTLRDAAGKTLIDAREATIDRGLVALARDRSDLGTVTLDGAAVDIERRADGSIDLVDALSPPKAAASDAPAAPPGAAAPAAGQPLGVVLRVTHGTLTLRTPELSAPLKAESLEMEVTLPAAAGAKLGWKIRLADPPGASPGRTLGVDGEYDFRAAGTPDLKVAVKGGRWPLATVQSGVTAAGELDGLLMVTRAGGLWSTSGEAKVLNLVAEGAGLSGDRLAFDAVGGAWEVAESAGTWSVRRLGLTSPVATLSATGSVTTAGALASPDARLEAKVDLATLSKQAPHALHLRDGLTLLKGSAKVVVQARADAAGQGPSQSLSVEANVSDLVARDAAGGGRTFTLRSPAVVEAMASRQGTAVRLDTLAVKAAFLDLTGSGDLEHGIKLGGSVDLAGLEAQLRDLVDFKGVELAGKGRMAGDVRKSGTTFLARYAAELKGLRVAGLTAAPVARDAVRFDAAVSGPADAAGLPTSWDNARVTLKSGEEDVAVAAKVKDGVTAGSVTASVPVTVSGRDGRADGRAIGRWTPKAGGMGFVALDELRLSLRPADPRLASGGLALAAKGTVDLDTEVVVLTPLPLAPGVVTPLTLTADGLVLHGYSKTPVAARGGKVALTGDVAAVEAALEVWYGRPATGLGGTLTVLSAVGGENGAMKFGLAVSCPDLSRAVAGGTGKGKVAAQGRQAEGPLALSASGTYAPESDRVAIEALKLATRYGVVDAVGTLDAPTGRRVADLSGTVAPNWQTLSALAAEMTEPNARLRGGARPFHVKGPLAGDSLAATLKGLDAELALDLTGADAFGLRLGPAPIVVRCGGGNVTMDPIVSTLNNGKVDLRPGLSVDDVNGIAFLLAPGSNLDGVEVNDEVSKRVLSYVAPVLNQATHVNGTIALDVKRAEFPITGPEDRRTNLTGRLEFQNVVFAPGPFATELLTLTGQPASAGVRLRQPVELSVANGRVVQKGLQIPLNHGAVIALEGSVGFDETLDLRATLPIGGNLLGAKTGLDRVVGGRNVVLPIDGTVAHPRVNKRALQVALKEMSQDVLKKELSDQASGLIDRIAPPAGGNARGGSVEQDLRGLGDQLLRGLGPKPRR